MKKLKAIPRNKLVSGNWYSGVGRGSNVAMWTGDGFIYIDRKYDQWVVKECDHYLDGAPFGCFFPMKRIGTEPSLLGEAERKGLLAAGPSMEKIKSVKNASKSIRIEK